MQRKSWRRLACLIVLLAVGVTAGMWIRNRIIEPTAGQHAEADLDKAVQCRQDATTFSDYPLLFAGDSVLGFPLVDCQHSKTAAQYDEQGRLFHSATDSYAFAYGTCEIPAGRESCAVPVTIIIDPPCSEFTVDSSFAKEKTTVRGAEAMVDESGTTWFATPSYKISVYPPGGTYAEKKANAAAIVEGLVPANAAASALTASAPLTTALGPSTVCP